MSGRMIELTNAENELYDRMIIVMEAVAHCGLEPRDVVNPLLLAGIMGLADVHDASSMGMHHLRIRNGVYHYILKEVISLVKQRIEVSDG